MSEKKFCAFLAEVYFPDTRIILKILQTICLQPFDLERLKDSLKKVLNTLVNKYDAHFFY